MTWVHPRLRVLSWNLWWRFGDWQRRQEAIAAVLAAERPDVCCLQEVWTTEEGGQAAALARQLGMHWALSPCPAPGRWQQRIGDDGIGMANAVLSRWPITRHVSRALSAAPGRVPEHTVLHARVAAPGGPVAFFTTHLESSPDQSATRSAQVRELARFVSEHREADRPPVLTGDLNAEPDSDEVRLLGGHKTAPVVPGLVLLDAWRYADAGDPGWTWDRRNPHVAATHEPSSRVDYVLVGAPGRDGAGHVHDVRLVGDRPVDGTWASDHAGVLAELQHP